MLTKLFGCELRYVEYCLASFSVTWGVWLLAPWDTFSSSPAFLTARDIAPEWAWGLMMATAGAWLWLALHLESYSLRQHALLLLMLLWLAVWAALVSGNWQGTSTVVYVHVALLCGFAYLRLSKRDLGR